MRRRFDRASDAELKDAYIQVLQVTGFEMGQELIRGQDDMATPYVVAAYETIYGSDFVKKHPYLPTLKEKIRLLLQNNT